MDYWGGVCSPHPLKLLGGLGPPPWPPSSYAYDLNPKKKKSVCVCVCGGGEVLEIKLFFRRGDQGQQLKEV